MYNDRKIFYLSSINNDLLYPIQSGFPGYRVLSLPVGYQRQVGTKRAGKVCVHLNAFDTVSNPVHLVTFFIALSLQS